MQPKAMTFQKDVYKEVFNLIPSDRTTRVLDAGAGEGYFSQKLKQSGYSVTACDFSKDVFKCSDIHFIESNLNEKIDCKDEQYDCVVCIEVIEHLENHFNFVSELFRITKPDGLVIITTPNILSFTSRLHFLFYGFTDCQPTPLDPMLPDYFMQHINPISLPELLFLIEKSGGTMTHLTTNRLRRSSLFLMPFLSLPLSIALRLKLFRGKYAKHFDLHRRHMRWLLDPANLMGRITIAAARKNS